MEPALNNIKNLSTMQEKPKVENMRNNKDKDSATKYSITNGEIFIWLLLREIIIYFFMNK